MTGTRIYRAGLGLPPAVTITSEPYRPDPSSSSWNIGETDIENNTHAPISTSTDSALSALPSLAYQPKPRYPQGYTSYAHWKEWHINPTHHGPEGSRGPPAFVRSQTRYDELGRSMIDGVDVEIDQGEAVNGEQVEGKQDGMAVAEWYTSLARSRQASPPRNREEEEDNQGLSDAGPSRPTRSNTPVIIDLTADDDEDDNHDNDNLSLTGASSIPGPLAPKHQEQPIRIHQNEWFIRRALAKAASSNSNSSPAPSARPSSIGGLLNIPPTVQNRSTEPVYVLGLDNKGHQILRERLGWGGGGLGRPEGWEGEVRAVRPNVTLNEEEGSPKGGRDGFEEGYSVVQGGQHEQIRTNTSRVGSNAAGSKRHRSGDNEEDAIALDDSSDEDEDEDEDENGKSIKHSVPSPTTAHPGIALDFLDIDLDLPLTAGLGASGPGRTAPIATALKLDRLGLGYQFNRKASNLPPGKASKARASAISAAAAAGTVRDKVKAKDDAARGKRVTHTHAQIVEAQRRAKYSLSGAWNRGEGEKLGKTGKVKWKEHNKRERDERRRMIAAMNE